MIKSIILAFLAVLLISDKCNALQTGICSVGSIEPLMNFVMCDFFNFGPCIFTKVDFYLYSRESRNGTLLTYKDIQNKCPTRNDRKLITLIHGWFKSIYYNWMEEIKDALLDAEDCYVLIPYYVLGSTDLYSRAYSCNVKVFAPKIAEYLKFLVDKCHFKRELTTCIGHSLGGQVCGLIGNYLKFGQIFGLDTSDICSVRLNDTYKMTADKADCTQICYTSCGGRLDLSPYCWTPFPHRNNSYDLGNIAYIVNGGISQPIVNECSLLTIFQPNMISPKCLMSNHFLCINLLKEMIKNTGNYVGVECDSCEDFKNGKCDCKKNPEKCKKLGLDICPKMNGKKGVFYINTLGKAPYAGFQYSISLTLCAKLENAKEIKSLKIKLIGSESNTAEFELNLVEGTMEVGTVQVLEKKLGEISQAELEIRSSRRRNVFLCVNSVKIVLINALNVEPFSEEYVLTKNSCQDNQLTPNAKCIVKK